MLARQAMTTSNPKARRNGIPLFPLQDVMLFPDVPRPLHIFEPRYQEMLLYALAGDRIIGMVMLQPDDDAVFAGTGGVGAHCRLYPAAPAKT